ncbi:DUF4135 domain-containing protein, partial [Kibdelosporangium lantanae]
FRSGARLGYKPRPMAVAAAFSTILDWFAENGFTPTLRAPRVVDRGGYGWVEWLRHEDCTSMTGARDFYRRAGALAAICYLLDAGDLHLENVIACGDHPVVIDLETLFHNDAPRSSGQRDFSATLTQTVLRTGSPVDRASCPIENSSVRSVTRRSLNLPVTGDSTVFIVLAPLGRARSPEAGHFHPAPRDQPLRLGLLATGCWGEVGRGAGRKRPARPNQTPPFGSGVAWVTWVTYRLECQTGNYLS